MTQCKISDLLDKSNVRKEELVCTQLSKTLEKVDAGGSCTLKCLDNKLESWSEQIQCGFDGDWKIPKTSLPLQCLASCDGEIFIKGKFAGSTRDLDITKEQVLARHCKPANIKETNMFVEGKQSKSLLHDQGNSHNTINSCNKCNYQNKNASSRVRSARS